MNLLDAAVEMRDTALSVGTKNEGIYPKAAPWEALQLPAVQLHNFIVADLCMALPGIRIQWLEEPKPKEDLHASALCILHHGINCRLNRLCVDATHRQPGGDGDGRQRELRDVAARAWLMQHWNDHGVVFKGGRSESEVQLSGGLALLKRTHPEVAEAVVQWDEASKATKLTAEQANAMIRMASSRKSPRGTMTQRQQRRSHRGTAALGKARKAGRSRLGAKALTQVQRNAVSLARKKVLAAVRTLHRKRGVFKANKYQRL